MNNFKSVDPEDAEL